MATVKGQFGRLTNMDLKPGIFKLRARAMQGLVMGI